MANLFLKSSKMCLPAPTIINSDFRKWPFWRPYLSMLKRLICHKNFHKIRLDVINKLTKFSLKSADPEKCYRMSNNACFYGNCGYVYCLPVPRRRRTIFLWNTCLPSKSGLPGLPSNRGIFLVKCGIFQKLTLRTQRATCKSHTTYF